ncbi:uncharacterized protein LOC108865256 [Galendromus occidentalis]|uniref:Uncharacterized protein LOC108865256 n=1 Tax=Galendromus occidentalis TaxID=34638 RepID=A0AAJ7PB30_9ACAR|nr:uncharacterized protein LOC108865256 [Galendromus occidentalis]
MGGCNLIIQTDGISKPETYIRFRESVRLDRALYVLMTSQENFEMVDALQVKRIGNMESPIPAEPATQEFGADRGRSSASQTSAKSSAEVGGTQQRLDDQVAAALEVRDRVFGFDERNKQSGPARKKCTPSGREVPENLAMLFDGQPITQNSSIRCKRAVSHQLKDTCHPEFPARATIYVFRTCLEIPLEDEHSHHRTFKPEEEELCFGLLTFSPDCPSNVPGFPVFSRNGRESVAIETLRGVVETQELWRRLTKFHSYIFKKVCRLSHLEYDPAVAPVIVPVRNGRVDVALLRRLDLAQKKPFTLESVVSRVTAGTEMSFFVREIYRSGGKTKLCLEKIPRSAGGSRNEFTVKTKFKEFSSTEARLAFAPRLEHCEVEFLSAPQWSKALTIPICIHRLDRLLVAENFRRALVRAGVGYEVDHWPPLVEDRPPNQEVSKPEIKFTELKFMKEMKNSPGPSPTDILTALTASSAQDIVDSERYEVLGDSFLKMVVSLHLLTNRDLRDEGTLTAERCRFVSNMFLLSIAVPRGIHEAVESRKFSVKDSFRPPGTILTAAVNEKLHQQRYRSKICADSVEALIGVYLNRSGPIGALDFLKYLGLELGDGLSRTFFSRFDLSYDPDEGKDPDVTRADLDFHSTHLERVQEIIAYRFGNPLYLLEAITHQSYQNNRTTQTYARLEFLGDAIIDFLVSSFIFTNNPHLSPGQMTMVRSALVSNDQLGQIMMRTKLVEYLLHDSPSLNEYMIEKDESHAKELCPDSPMTQDDLGAAGLLVIPKTFGDLMESIIGAIFIDSGLDFAVTWDVFRRLISDPLLIDTLRQPPQNLISTLQGKFPERCRFEKPVIRGDNLVEVTLHVDCQSFGVISTNQKKAKLILASMALKAFCEDGGIAECSSNGSLPRFSS